MHVPKRAGRSLPPVHLMDVAPTLHQFFGLPSFVGFDGVSLLGEIPEDRALISEELPVQVVRIEKFVHEKMRTRDDVAQRIDDVERGTGYESKIALTRRYDQLVVRRNTGVRAYFDLARDPGVSNDVGGTDATGAAELEDALESWLLRTSETIGCRAAQRTEANL